MNQKFKFEILTIWQKAMNLAEIVADLSEAFPKKERFRLTDQLCRAADSIALNIAEGSIGQSIPNTKRYLTIGIASLSETVCCLIKANNRKYITEEKFNKLYSFCYHLMNQIIAYRKRL